MNELDSSQTRNNKKQKTSELIDLNTSKTVSESLNWPISHAVRALLLNAFDADSKNCSIEFVDDNFQIKNENEGLSKDNLIYKPNPSKIENPDVGGKFGYGLKDAIAILTAHNIRWEASSNHGTFKAKIASDRETVHVEYCELYPLEYVGTVQRLYPPDIDSFREQVKEAKSQCIFFNESLKNCIVEHIEGTKGKKGDIYFFQDIKDYTNSQLYSTLFVHNCGYDLQKHSIVAMTFRKT